MLPNSRSVFREWLPFLLLAAGFLLSLSLISRFDWGQGRERAWLLVWCSLFVGLLATKPPLASPSSRGLHLFAICVWLGSLAYHNYLAYHYVRHGTGFIDILTITQDAVEHFLQGRNPYTQNIDTQWPDPRYQGFKYSPLMLLFYVPIRWIGPHGVVFFHLVMNLTIGLLLFLLCRRGIGVIPGYLACSLYLVVPVVSYESYNQGANDIIGTALVLLALLWIHQPGRVGLLLGLSVSTKLMPAALCAVAFLPKHGLFRYIGGFALGIVPIAVALAISPKAFLDNVVFFPLSRTIDNTSWLYGQPLWIIRTAKFCFLGAVGLTALLALFGRYSTKTRLFLAFFLLTASLLSSSAVHRNYFLWWLPFLLLVLFFGTYSSHRPISSES